MDFSLVALAVLFVFMVVDMCCAKF